MQNDHFIYGLQTIKHRLQKTEHGLKQLYIIKNRKNLQITECLNLASSKDIPINYCEKGFLDSKLPNCNHQGIAALANKLKVLTENDCYDLIANLQEPAKVLLLDQVQDPHNLGACLRVAEAAGIHVVILPKNQSAPLNPIVEKVSCGALENIAVAQITNFVRCINKLKEQKLWIIGADGKANSSLYKADFKVPIAIILGNEGKGLRHLTKQHCDFLYNIPMLGCIESLNVSTATAVFLYEMVRQRSYKI